MGLQRNDDDKSNKIIKQLHDKLEHIKQILCPEELDKETQEVNSLRNKLEEIIKNKNQLIDAAFATKESLISEDLENIKQNLSKLEKIKETLTENEEVVNQYIEQVNKWKKLVEAQENITKDPESIREQIDPNQYYLTPSGVKLGEYILAAIVAGAIVVKVAPFIYAALLNRVEQALVSEAIELVSRRGLEDGVEVIQERIEQVRELENQPGNPQASAEIRVHGDRLVQQREWAEADEYLRARGAERRNAIVNIPNNRGSIDSGYHTG